MSEDDTMPALDFQPRFAGPVESGRKKQTVRRRQFRVGQPVYLYTGQRTAACRRLGVGHVVKVRDITIDYRNGVEVIKLDGTTLAPIQMEHFALADGFRDLEDFIQFFFERYEFPFRGQVVYWELTR